jgi:type II secretory pathway pseudopilin PulG
MKKPLVRTFTLIELLSVILIVIVLVGIGLGIMNIALHSGYESKTKATIKKLEMALESYKIKHGYYIQAAIGSFFYIDDTGFREFIDFEKMNNEDAEDVRDVITPTIVRRRLLDGWGNPLYYCAPGFINRTSFDLLSLGADGKPGVSGVNDADYDYNQNGTIESSEKFTDGGTMTGYFFGKPEDAWMESRFGDDVTNY